MTFALSRQGSGSFEGHLGCRCSVKECTDMPEEDSTCLQAADAIWQAAQGVALH